MSRNQQDQQRRYEERRLPEPRQPDYPGPRTNPACYSSRTFRTDPAWYNSRTTNRDSWRGQLSFESSLPYDNNSQLEPVHNYLPDPNSLPSTTLADDKNTERSVQHSRHLSSSEERASERHAPRAHASRETRRPEGRSSENSGRGGKRPARKKDFGDLFANPSFHKGTSRADASHASTSNAVGRPIGTHYTEAENRNMINCIKAGMNWCEISKDMNRNYDSVKTHWYRVLSKEAQAKGVKYNPL